MWGDLRRQLGFDDMTFDIGTWWCVPHDTVVHHPDGPYPGWAFAKKGRPGDGRRVVLGSAFGPNARLYPRSTSIPSSFEHQRHAHATDDHRCKLDCRGWINFRQPVSVDRDVLTTDYFSCEEPEGSPLFDRIEEAGDL